MKYLFIFLLLFSSVTYSQTKGYTVSVLNKETIDFSLPSHLIVAGQGQTQRTLFQNSGASKGIKYQDSDPSIQVVMIAANEEGYYEMSRLLTWGFHVVNTVNAPFDNTHLIREAMQFQKIASIDFFGHASLSLGLQLGDYLFLRPDDPGLSSLTNHFTDGAFAMIFGCNTGFRLAPALSQIWQIPVAGTFTSADFERLHSSNEFYPYDEKLRPDGDWSIENAISFQLVRNCDSSGCFRMRPDNFPYDGIHGSYEGGLPFPKFFCVGIKEEKCLRAMALSLKGFVGTKTSQGLGTRADYIYSVQEFLCPIHNTNNVRQTCRQQLTEAETSGKEDYSPFLGSMLQCDFLGCEYQLDCQAGRECEVRNPNRTALTFVQEYKNYLKAFDLL